ncbi:MAG: FG-GAP repeat protein [Chloroflexi bacterium]|nr:FG-GAP repeat protein [Chloroflexota bacterium]
MSRLNPLAVGLFSIFVLTTFMPLCLTDPETFSARASGNNNSWLEQQKLTASDAGFEDMFGSSIALDGDTALVGAYGDACEERRGCGSAYVFVRRDGVWYEQAKLVANDPQISFYFGWSVALDGNTAVIGSIWEGCDEVYRYYCGSVYVFTREGENWTQQARIMASDATSADGFGTSVALDGDTLLVGAPDRDCDAGSGCGTVYVFVKQGRGWRKEARLTSDIQNNFGWSVAIDGDTALIGARSEKCNYGIACGNAYIFTREDDRWTQQARLEGRGNDPVDQFAWTTSNVDQFGWSVTLDDNTILIGAVGDDCFAGPSCGSVFMFTPEDGIWYERARFLKGEQVGRATFGWSLALDNDTALIGAKGTNCASGERCGAAYILMTSEGPFAQQIELTASDATPEDLFGYSVALDGNTALIGAPQTSCEAGEKCGSVYIFTSDSQP